MWICSFHWHNNNLSQFAKFSGDVAAKNDEITKLKKDLKDALENASSGDEVKQLKEENEQLKKKNEDAMKKIRELEEEILILNKGMRWLGIMVWLKRRKMKGRIIL